MKKNDKKIIVVALIGIIVGLLGIYFGSSVFYSNKVVVPDKNSPVKTIVDKDDPKEEKEVEKDDTIVNLGKAKTEFEILLEKYTFGD